MSVLYPTAAIRELIDETVRDDSLTADAKARELSLLKEDLSVMVGEIDRHLLEARKLAEAERLVQSSAMMQLRESADIRDELIRRGLATETQMDATGYRSHEQLDAWLADRFGLEEALIGGLRQKWAELKHPRGRGGGSERGPAARRRAQGAGRTADHEPRRASRPGSRTPA